MTLDRIFTEGITHIYIYIYIYILNYLFINLYINILAYSYKQNLDALDLDKDENLEWKNISDNLFCLSNGDNGSLFTSKIEKQYLVISDFSYYYYIYLIL